MGGTMKYAGVVFLLFVTLVSPAVNAQDRAAVPWELGPVRCNRQDLLLNERLLCSVPELGQAYAALTATYREKATQLDAAQIESLRIEHNFWFLQTCMGDVAGRYPLSADVARACLLKELPRRRQFVRDLPTDRPAVPYMLTRFERAMMQRFFGSGLGLRNDPKDALQGGLMRVFGAILPDKLEKTFDPTARPVSYFMQIGDVVLKLEGDRYVVAWGAQPRNGGFQGAFVVDMETGETSLAFIDATKPSFSAWEKACISSPFRDMSRELIRKATAQGSFRPISAESEIAGEFDSTPCR